MPFTFLNGVFAFALAAVGVPILIHLLNRRRSKREPFSSLEFLEEVTRRQRRRIQLRQWILLALRMLAVACVVLAMMRPAVRSGLPGGAGDTAATVIFDTSYSMAAGTEAASTRELADSRLAELGTLFSAGDRVQLLFPDAEPTRAFDGPVQDFDRLEGAAKRAPLRYVPANPYLALEEAGRDLSQSTALNREIYVLSDFQAADWEWGDRMPDLSTETRVYLVPLATDDLPNVAIANAAFVQASIRSGSSGAVRVTLANHSEDALSGHPVRVFVGDEVVADGTIGVPANDVATADLPLIRELDPSSILEVRIDEDALAVDDVAWVTTGERQTIRVLIVHGGGMDTAQKEPYLRLALDPPGQVGERFFTVNEIALRDLPVETDLDYDVFVLNNVERLSEGVAERLRLAHRDGAGVLMILGDRVDLRYYNTHVLPGLLDVTLESALSANGNHFTLRPEVIGHPIFDGFRVGMGEDLSQAKFTKLVASDVGPGARVLAKLGNYPGIVESERVILMTSAADLRWGNFPTGGSFLPFLHQAMLDLASAAIGARQALAGEPIVTELSLDDVSGDITVFAPNGEALAYEQQVVAGNVIVRTDPAPVPGAYRFDSGGSTRKAVSVHLDPDEGRLRYADPTAITERFEGNVAILGGDAPLSRRVLQDRQGREIWPILIVLALAFLVAESIIGRMRLA
jgi:hypothetical protein